MSHATEAAKWLTTLLQRETLAARRAALPELIVLAEEKREAFAALAAAGTPQGPDAEAATRALLAAAEENALVLGAVAGAIGTMEMRLRRDLAAATDPGVYAPQTRLRRPPRHSLAARVDRMA
ncbi:hypothetical protein [Paracraurococcus ruber]|uniref:FlgN protein n=1 Tax=Paracraurococcus ruber TaxID=77675 RepID=A0ABS1CRL6_9PROT|nr:hypothetical protein [Paracraurococcus ruber]MBK1656627.1 hypothetical protein [Paracraurococcus ruber]TDG33749.1 hypothetical protein E2C05_02725 [Paracraurococcus ruber]